MDPQLISAIAGTALGGIQVEFGKSQEEKAADIIKDAKRPTYRISQPIKDNQNFAEAKASEGLSDNAKQVYSQNADRGQAASIDAIIKGGGNVNNIAEIYGTQLNAAQQYSLLDDEMRARNARQMIDQNREMGGELDKEWQLNVFDPFADQIQAAATLRKQGTENFSRGLNSLVSTAANYGIAELYKKEGKGVYPKIPELPSNPNVSMDDYSRNRNMPSTFHPVQKKFPGLTGSYHV